MNARLAPPWLDRESWPFDARWTHTNDGTPHYVDEGRGAPVVLVHGTPTWSFEWRHVITALRATHRVIAHDHLGFGLSERPRDADYSPQAHARRFRQFIASLALDQPITLVVHDFGGPIALDWALSNPQLVAHLVVVNSWMWSFGDDPRMTRNAKFVHGTLGRWMYRRLNASLRLGMPSAYGNRAMLTREIHQQYLAAFADLDGRDRVLWALARSLLDSANYFDSLWNRRAPLSSLPVTLLWGMKDSAFTPDMLARWERVLPHAHTLRFNNAGHWPHEEAPGDVIAALRSIA